MPRISVFYGIIIAMDFDDHPPAHFHAKYGEYEAQVAIATGEILNGDSLDEPEHSSRSGRDCIATN